jgi:hypothetical protein
LNYSFIFAPEFKPKPMKSSFIVLVLSMFLLSSCFVNRTTVGFGPVGASLQDRTYSKAKQRYVLFGLVRINNANPKTPPVGMGYEVKSSFTIVDGVLSILWPIYGQRTVKILVTREDEQALRLKESQTK